MAIRRSEYLIGTAAEWAALNPVLTRGQLAVESGTDAIKIGDGTTRWNSLDYTTPGTGLDDVLDGGTP